MIKKIKNIFYSFAVLVLLLPVLALAVDDPCYPGSINPETGICLPKKPLKVPDYGTISHLVSQIIETLVLIAGLISAVFVVVGGYKYLMAGGEEEKVKSARAMITNALLGLVITLLSYALVRIVLSIVAGKI